MMIVPALPSPTSTFCAHVTWPDSTISFPAPALIAPLCPTCNAGARQLPPASESVPLLPRKVSADVAFGRLDHFPVSPQVPSALVHVCVLASNEREIASELIASASARMDRDPRICAAFMSSPSPKQARDVLAA